MNNIPPELILKQMEIGPLQNFLYFVGDAQSKQIAVVDPAWDIEYLRDEARQNHYKITAVFLTHGHPDHVNGLVKMLEKHDVPAYISKHEALFYKPRHKNIIEVENHHKLKIGNIEFECLLTPGHTPGCQLFKYKNVVITGDTLFIDGCGRCDLPGGDAKKMYQSLNNVIKKFPDETLLFPGHNYGPTPYATVGSQKKTNPYMLCESEDDFVYHRLDFTF